MKQKNGLVPCHCPKCKGCLRSKRTERLHRAAARNAYTEDQQANVPNFADWRNMLLSGRTGNSDSGHGMDLGSESEMSSQSSGNEEHNPKRSTKRQRGEDIQVSYDFKLF